MAEKKNAKPRTKKKRKPKAGSERLTPAMEVFVLRLVAGDSQRVAYRTAYPACNASDSYVDAKASRLFSMGKVGARYNELQREAMQSTKDSAIAQAVEVLEVLSGIARGSKKFPSYDAFGNEFERYPSMGAMLKALEMLGKHHKLFTEMREVQQTETIKVVLTDD